MTKIGIPKETKIHEYRVGLTPESVAEIVGHGHSVVVETGAGAGIGCTDDNYRSAGAFVVDTAEEVFARGELIVKVKEPEPDRAAPTARRIMCCSPIFTWPPIPI